jgi:hypothetical protein
MHRDDIYHYDSRFSVCYASAECELFHAWLIYGRVTSTNETRFSVLKPKKFELQL